MLFTSIIFDKINNINHNNSKLLNKNKNKN